MPLDVLMGPDRGTTQVRMEIHQPGEAADALVEQLGYKFMIGGPDDRRWLVVYVDSGGLEVAREKIATVAEQLNPAWEDYIHFVTDFSLLFR